MDRSIPHVRDIFAPYRSVQDTAHDKIHVYQHSPGTRRRRHEVKEDLPPQDFIDTDHSDSTDDTPVNNNREQQQIRTRDRSRHSNNNNANRNSYTDILYDKNEMNSSKGGYSSKTLTERDIRHLERHLSMKKTIRKQISRNLAQAFVDDTVVFQGDSNTPIVQPAKPSPAPQEPPVNNSNYSFTLTRAKMAARSEHTFLDMLKKDSTRGPCEADSGHSSPSHQGGFEDDPVALMEVDYEAPQSNSFSGKQESHARHDYHSQQGFSNDQHKKQSFWKKFGFKGKAKR